MPSLRSKRSETRKISHNPEVSGSNTQGAHCPLPATKVKPESCPQGDATRGSGFSFPKGTQSRAWRTAVDFSSHGDASRNGGISYTSVHLRCEPQFAGYVKIQSFTFLSQSHRRIPKIQNSVNFSRADTFSL